MWSQTLQRAVGKLLQQLCSIAAITMSLKSSEKLQASCGRFYKVRNDLNWSTCSWQLFLQHLVALKAIKNYSKVLHLLGSLAKAKRKKKKTRWKNLNFVDEF